MIHVVAAVIRDSSSHILIARRAEHLHQGGLWEFPGGKREPGEDREQALRRELFEELGIRVTQYRPLIQIPHEYPDKSVLLDVWEVTRWQGEAHGREDQPIKWILKERLKEYDFPSANMPIIKACQLPAHYLITPALEGEQDAFLEQLQQALLNGASLVQYRQKGLIAERFRSLAQQVVTICHEANAKILLNADTDLVLETGADGLQVNAGQLMSLQERPMPDDYLVAASCHNAKEIRQAGLLGLDFALLSPVQATATHPEAKPLGWQQFASLVADATLPIYALGGVSRADTQQAWRFGGQGIAAIRALWEVR